MKTKTSKVILNWTDVIKIPFKRWEEKVKLLEEKQIRRNINIKETEALTGILRTVTSETETTGATHKEENVFL